MNLRGWLLQTGLIASLAVALIPSISRSQELCADLFSAQAIGSVKTERIAPRAFDHTAFENSKRLLRSMSQAELEQLVPFSPEEKLAWLETLSERTNPGALNDATSLVPRSRRAQTKMIALMAGANGSTRAVSPKQLRGLLDLIYKDSHLSSEVLPHLVRLRFDAATNVYIRRRLESGFRTQGLIEALRSAGILSHDRMADQLRLKWMEKRERYRFVLESVLSVGAVVGTVNSGNFAGALTPVWRSVKSQTLPPELATMVFEQGIERSLPALRAHYGLKASGEVANFALSRALQLATTIAVAVLIADDLAKEFGIDLRDTLDEFTHDRAALERAALDAVEADADEMGLTVDPATKDSLHKETIKALERIISAKSKR